MRPRLVVTADDFGAAVAVNDAVEQAHRAGILTAASLMVAGAAAADAVARARRLPGLGVGLHVVLVEGRPVLPAGEVPDLVDGAGCFRADMARAGIDIFFRPAARRQVAREIAAQFAAFAATGLPLDHVNAHRHFHLHPTIAGLILRIGRRHGMRSVRAPIEPRGVLAAIEPATPRAGIERPWALLARRRLRAAGMIVPDSVFGLAWSGAMTEARIAAILARLPPGLSEIYCHPARDGGWPGAAPGYLYADELAGLIGRSARDALAARGAVAGRFADFA